MSIVMQRRQMRMELRMEQEPGQKHHKEAMRMESEVKKK
jgi:hypothetical protein